MQNYKKGGEDMKVTINSLENKYGISIEKEYNFGTGKEVFVVYKDNERYMFDNLYQIQEFMKKGRKK